jgi:hypothetical protein
MEHDPTLTNRRADTDRRLCQALRPANRPFMFTRLYERIGHPVPELHGGEPDGAGTLETSRPEIGLWPALAARSRQRARACPGRLVSLERARRAYGVAIDPERMIVLEDDTAALRACVAKRSLLLGLAGKVAPASFTSCHPLLLSDRAARDLSSS